MSLVASGAWFCWPAPILPRLLGPDSPVPMNPHEASWMIALVEVGNLISPLPASYLSDRYGRKLIILLCGPLFLIGLCLTVYLKSFVWLCVARIIQGIAMAIPYAILPLYLGEISSAEFRGTITSLFHIAWGLGCLIPYCIGPFLSYDIFTYSIFLVTVIFVVCFIPQPESPYFHAMKGNDTKATAALRILRNNPTEDLIKSELREIQKEVKRCLEEKASWKDMFATHADRKALLLILIVGVVSFLSGQNAILAYTTETFSKFPNHLISVELVTIGIGFSALVGSVFSIFTSDSCGRRFLLLVSSFGCMISLFTASVYFYLYSNTELDTTHYSWVAPVAVMSYNFFVTAGMHPVCVTYTSELFPTKTRGTASSISSINMTICSFLVLKFHQSIESKMGLYFIYLIYGTTCFVGIFLFYFVMPETKGKTFLEIREALEGRNKQETPTITPTLEVPSREDELSKV